MLTSLSLTPAGTFAWRLAWTGDDADATYRVFRDGRLLATTRLTELLVGATGGAPPVFEVLDDPEAEPAAGFPATATLAWYASAGAARYRVEQDVGGNWTEVDALPDDGSGYFRWTSDALADVTAYDFRVVPVGANGNDGTPLEYAVLMVRVPEPPAVAYSYDAGTGNVTISAA
jgi:hypothetical protein